jgi:hypothetical protein
MARVHYWQYIADEEGRPIPNVKVDFYLKDTETLADIYANTSVNHTTDTTTLNLKTNTDGYFEFWVGDQWETNGGYDPEQRFRLEWYKAGIVRGEIDNIDLFPPLYEVVINSTAPAAENARKNKLISNKIAKDWYDHVESMLPSASPHNIHPVVICSTNNDYNKVVSNFLMNKIHTTAVSASVIDTLDTSGASLFTTSGVSFPTSAAQTFVHGLNNDWPVVQVYNEANNTLIAPDIVESIDSNTIQITLFPPITATVTIIG